jgi:hypothetical protein
VRKRFSTSHTKTGRKKAVRMMASHRSHENGWKKLNLSHRDFDTCTDPEFKIMAPSPVVNVGIENLAPSLNRGTLTVILPMK